MVIVQGSGRAAGAYRAEQGGAQVAVSPVGQDGDDGPGVKAFGRTERRGNRRAAGHADEQPFPYGKQAGGLEGILILYGHYLVQILRAIDLRHDCFLHILETLDLVADTWFDPNDTDPIIPLFQVTTGSHEG